MSDTPTCFFLKPSFQSAYPSRTHLRYMEGHNMTLRTFATLPAPPLAGFFLGAAAAFFPAFLDGA